MYRLKELRTKYGLSLRKLQEYTKIDFSRLAIIEKTDANVESKTIQKLCDFFMISDTYLFGKDGFIFYYDEHNKKYFPMLYNQYKGSLTDDVVSWSIVDNRIRRIISLEGFDRINKIDECVSKDLELRIKIEHFLRLFDEMDDFNYKRYKERVLEYFTIKELRRDLLKKDEK